MGDDTVEHGNAETPARTEPRPTRRLALSISLPYPSPCLGAACPAPPPFLAKPANSEDPGLPVSAQQDRIPFLVTIVFVNGCPKFYPIELFSWEP